MEIKEKSPTRLKGMGTRGVERLKRWVMWMPSAFSWVVDGAHTKVGSTSGVPRVKMSHEMLPFPSYNYIFYSFISFSFFFSEELLLILEYFEICNEQVKFINRDILFCI